MLLRYEIKKQLSNYAIYPIILFLFIITLVSMYDEGYFGHDFCNRLDEYSCSSSGKLITGTKAYEYNKKVATHYKGVVDDNLLKKLHKKYKDNPHVKKYGSVYYDSTYNYFKTVFHINDNKYLKTKDVYVTDNIIYGFTGDWQALYEVLDKFFLIFIFLTVAFASPIFAGEHEHGIAKLLATTYEGRKVSFLKTKLYVVLLFVNITLFTCLGIIICIHFMRYGFSGADISVQIIKKYCYSMLRLNLWQFTLYKTITGILGINFLSLFTCLISLYCKNTFNCFLIVALYVFAFERKIWLFFFKLNIIDYVLTLAPINSFKLMSINILPEISYIYLIEIVYILLYILTFIMIKRLWRQRKYWLSCK